MHIVGQQCKDWYSDRFSAPEGPEMKPIASSNIYGYFLLYQFLK